MGDDYLYKHLRKKLLNNTIVIDTLTEELSGFTNNSEIGKIYELSKLKTDYGIRYRTDKKNMLKNITLSEVIMLLNKPIRKIISSPFKTEYKSISIKREG